jgi:hypothetical protein
MTEAEFNSYFEDVATKLIDISHNPENGQHRFATDEELINGLKDKFDSETYILSVIKEDGQLSNLYSLANIVEGHNACFFILKNNPDGGADAVPGILDETLLVAKKVLSKMIKDLKERNGIMKNLEPDRLQFQKVGPICDLHYGWKISFTLSLKSGCDYKYNQEDWIE